MITEKLFINADASLDDTSEELSCGEKLQWTVVTDSSGIDGDPTFTLEIKVGGIWAPFNLNAEVLGKTVPKSYCGLQMPGSKFRIKYAKGGSTVGTYSIYIEFKKG